MSHPEVLDQSQLKDRAYDDTAAITTDSVVRLRKPRLRPTNPLQAGFAAFLSQHVSTLTPDLFSALPKRYTLYPPLLLLPSNVFTTTPGWSTLYSSLAARERVALYACIAESFRQVGVTHIALIAPIATRIEDGDERNVMRRPTGLVTLFGDFGTRDEEGDFAKAFWIRTVQNGVVQVWAPLWTMFSRGNVKEKARIMGEGTFKGLDGVNCDLENMCVVDMFVGIGYFAFSYLRRGVEFIWGWEINAWSVEGLRRGAQANGWRVEVLIVGEDGEIGDQMGNKGEEALMRVIGKFGPRSDMTGQIRCIVFQGDNKWAVSVMENVMAMCNDRCFMEVWNTVRHINLGLLPHARESWTNAVKLLDRKLGGWLHVHENVDMRGIELAKEEIVREFGRLAEANRHGRWTISCCHVEEVKTYAPGVMHCVFDIQILPEQSTA